MASDAGLKSRDNLYHRGQAFHFNNLNKKTPGVSSGRFVNGLGDRRSPPLGSAGVELDNELLVDERIDLGALRDAGNSCFHFLTIHIEPVHGRNGLGEIEHAEGELL